VIPGQHICLAAKGPEAILWGLSRGLEHRDTLLVLMSGSSCLLLHLFRVPLQESTVAAQVLATGTGALWIDGSRVRTTESLNGGAWVDLPGAERSATAAGMLAAGKTVGRDYRQPSGRWPPNLLLVHHPECVQDGTKKVKPGNGSGRAHGVNASANNLYGLSKGRKDKGGGIGGFVSEDGLETVQSWDCHPSCPVGVLDRQSGALQSGVYGGIGGASRFYPQFTSLAECLDWVNRLINGPVQIEVP